MAEAAELSLEQVLEAWGFSAPALRHGSGHINDTFRVGGAILQRMSAEAFAQPGKVMENIVSVTDFLAESVARAGGDPERQVLRPIFTRSGESFFTDSSGGAWRAFRFVEDSVCYERAGSPAVLESAAGAFGRFQRMLDGYPAETLHETIPRFHDTEERLDKLRRAVEADAFGRAAQARQEIDFALARAEDCSVLLGAQRRGELPLRVCHNDTKLSNVLFDRSSGESLCVIDLDTTMPGLAVNDFGDTVRGGAAMAAEDSECSALDMELYAACARGFLRGTGRRLTDEEVRYLPWGARMMTLECGIRFLADHLEGDVYFRTTDPEQNLRRCRGQFSLLQDMERRFGEMERIIKDIWISENLR